MKRIEEYTKQLHTSVSNYWMQKSSLWITQLCGKSGMGKTSLAQSYLEAYGGQYFSFRNLDAAFAPQIFRPECKLWREFFAEIGETKNRPVIFFDDVDDSNDKEGFLNVLPELVGKAYEIVNGAPLGYGGIGISLLPITTQYRTSCSSPCVTRTLIEC